MAEQASRGTALVSIRSFSSEARVIAAARAFVGRFAVALPRAKLGAARLAVSELVTNAVEHSAGSRIQVRVRVTRRTMRVEVSDAGTRPFSPSGSPGESVRGRGLLLVDALTDRSGIDRRPNTVAWFEIDRSEDGERPAGAAAQERTAVGSGR